MVQFFDGTTSYYPARAQMKGWEFELRTRFSQNALEELTIFQMHELQQDHHGDLRIRKLPDGSPEIVKRIVAHGPESARLQALDLNLTIKDRLGLDRLNIASGIELRAA